MANITDPAVFTPSIEIVNILSTLKICKSTVMDMIPNVILKHLSNKSGELQVQILNINYFPNIFKDTTVIDVHKPKNNPKHIIKL